MLRYIVGLTDWSGRRGLTMLSACTLRTAGRAEARRLHRLDPLAERSLRRDPPQKMREALWLKLRGWAVRFCEPRILKLFTRGTRSILESAVLRDPSLFPGRHSGHPSRWRFFLRARSTFRFRSRLC